MRFAQPRAVARPFARWTAPEWITEHRSILRMVVRAAAISWLVFFWVWLIGMQSTFLEVDAEAYWGLDMATLYEGVVLGDQDAFLYSPAVAFIFAPFSALPYEVFYALLAAVNLLALVWLLRPELAALSLFLIPVSNEVARGNIHLLLAVAIVVGFRYSGSWAWVFLTKVTPGIGVAWFAVRREWRNLAYAIGVTAAIVAVTFAIAPELWIRWVEMLANSAGMTRPSVLEIPVLPRLMAAAAVMAFAGWRNQRWLVPVAALLALPAIWVNSLALLVAVVPLWVMQRRAAQSSAASVEAGEGTAPLVLVPVPMDRESGPVAVPVASRTSIRK